MAIFFYTVTVLISIFIGFVLSKGYTLLKDYKKREEDLAYLHSQIKELKDGIIRPVQNNTISNHNNSIPNQKYNLPAPKIILDNKAYSQQEFFREINNGKFQISPMLQSKLHAKNK